MRQLPSPKTATPAPVIIYPQMLEVMTNADSDLTSSPVTNGDRFPNSSP